MTATTPRRRSAEPPEALTSDAWYTLLYLPTAERLALASRRRRLWSEPLLEAGLGRNAALRLLDRRDRWARELEERGRTPAVREQVARLEGWLGRPLRTEGLTSRLDATLLRAKVLLAPGALAAVRELDDRGVRLGVVSNVLNETGTAARTVLERLGLLRHFAVVVLSCEHPWAKPAPQPFEIACRFLGVRPQRAVHIGDLGYDLDGARLAGMRAWWYSGLRRLNRYLPAQVDPAAVPKGGTVRSWSEVPRRFEGRAPRA